MPEGPEVKLYVKYLNKFFKNNEIYNIKILSGRYKKHNKPQLFRSFKNNLPTKIIYIKSKGKFIYFLFDNNYYMWNTLGMSGFWTNENYKHNNIVFKTNKGNIYFNDQRNFGTIKFTKSKIETDKKLNSIGPDIFVITFKEFKNNILKYPNKKIAEVIINQKIISGIGNYISSEMLWLAKISPHRLVKKINNYEIKKLYLSAKKVIYNMYELNDKEMEKLLKGDNKFLINYKKRDFIVYRQTIDKYGNKIKRDKIKGRSKYWVPERQT